MGLQDRCRYEWGRLAAIPARLSRHSQWECPYQPELFRTVQARPIRQHRFALGQVPRKDPNGFFRPDLSHRLLELCEHLVTPMAWMITSDTARLIHAVNGLIRESAAASGRMSNVTTFSPMAATPSFRWCFNVRMVLSTNSSRHDVKYR